MKSKRLVVIVGPTAVGKTALAVQLALELRTEIISADSRQVFREMQIGTAKPSAEELSAVPHHFINTKSIHDEYNAGRFERDALGVITALFGKKDDLVMVGGSGLYIRAVCEGFDDLPEVPEGLREQIMSEYKEHGIAWLQKQVEEVDPDFFAQVDKTNPHRLVRALELNYGSGSSVSTFRQKNKPERPFEILKIGLELERTALYERIDRRMDNMIAAGLFDEAKQFYPFKDLNALQTVGYQEAFDYFDGLYDQAEAIRLMKRNSRRFAKRQLTWFKRDRSIQWFHPDQWAEIIQFTMRHGG
jgi:tRNA dimethylallyltransferase